MTCGIHVTDTRPCRWCALAASANAAALADVEQRPADGPPCRKRLTPSIIERIVMLADAGQSKADITRATGFSHRSVTSALERGRAA